jgi:hypothetical protein
MSPPNQGPQDLEARIRELEIQMQRFVLRPDLAAFSAGDCTNGCTDACTHACTNGCTGGGCLTEVEAVGEVEGGG